MKPAVVLMAYGSPSQADEIRPYLEDIREGPRYAEVTKIDQESKEFSGRLPDFDVKF